MSNDRKIYTKTGDKGETSLLGGTRVPKYHERIEAYGTLDELNSFVGFLRDQVDDASVKILLLEIQDRLFTAESLIATEENVPINKMLPQLYEEDILKLEAAIDEMNSVLPGLTSFLLPGGHPQVSLCHICRTVCRRAERLVIKLASETQVDWMVIRYLNRLSDYFFVLSRWVGQYNNVADLIWKPRI